MKRHAVVVPGFGRDSQDMCVPVISEWVEDLARQERVDVFTLQYPVQRGQWSAFGATVHGFGQGGLASGGRAVPEVVQAIAREHAREPFAQITAVFAEEGGAAAVLAGRTTGVPVTVVVAGAELATPEDAPGRRGWRRSLRRGLALGVIRAADRVVAPSRWLAERVPRRSEVIPWRVRAERFQRPRVPGGGARVLCAASLVPLKGVYDLLHAWPLVIKRVPEATLEIAGDGPDLLRLTAMARWLPSVSMLGRVPYDQMPEVFSRADVLIHPSWWEAQGMVIEEALAAGLRVVATSVGRGAELTEEEGIQVEPGDIFGMARGVESAVRTVREQRRRASVVDSPGL